MQPCVSVSEGSSAEAEVLEESRIRRVCDKLIGVFMVDKPTPTHWRRLLAFSREWSNLRPHFFARCLERADAAEEDPAMKEKLLRLARKLKQVSFISILLFAFNGNNIYYADYRGQTPNLVVEQHQKYLWYIKYLVTKEFQILSNSSMSWV